MKKGDSAKESAKKKESSFSDIEPGVPLFLSIELGANARIHDHERKTVRRLLHF